MKLALGTVQFGLPYGVTNVDGQVPESEIARILRLARSVGIDMLDTAAAYGDSERILGKLAQSGCGFHIYSKTISLCSSHVTAIGVDDVLRRVELSLKNLGVTSLKGLFVHHAGDLLCEEGGRLYRELSHLRDAGFIEHIGVSVYSPKDALNVLDHFDIDVIQLPLNVMDQSFLAENILQRLKTAGVEIHTRSAFLQGALLSRELPPFLHSLDEGFSRFRDLCDQAGVSPLEGCLGFLRQQRAIDRVVIGVTSASQLEEIHDAWIRCVNLANVDFAPCDFSGSPAVNPANWQAMELALS